MFHDDKTKSSSLKTERQTIASAGVLLKVVHGFSASPPLDGGMIVRGSSHFAALPSLSCQIFESKANRERMPSASRKINYISMNCIIFSY